MKLIRPLSIAALFFVTLSSCNQNSKDGTAENNSLNKKDTTIVTSDTITNPGVNGGVTKNNPDITK